MDSNINVWDGHDPKPEGKTIMGCSWLMDHFQTVYNQLAEVGDKLRVIQTTLVVFFVLQMIFDITVLFILL